jgi:hypothetical protein
MSVVPMYTASWLGESALEFHALEGPSGPAARDSIVGLSGRCDTLGLGRCDDDRLSEAAGAAVAVQAVLSTGYCNGGHVWTFAAFGSSTRNVRPYTMCVPPKSIPPAGGEGGHGGGTHRAQPRQLGQLHELGLATLLASLHQPRGMGQAVAAMPVQKPPWPRRVAWSNRA